MERIEDELAEVVVETSLVDVEAFLRAVFAAMVDVDADRTGELYSQSDGFDFREGESLAESGTMTIADSLAPH